MPAGQLTMWPLLLLSLLSGGLVLTSKVQNECAKGAAYWCSNLMTAIKCGALDHCVQNGWNQASNESVWNRISNEDMCADCKQLISILVRMAKESTFKETLQKYLEHECTNLPLQTLIPQCQALVKDFYARLIASLEEQFDPSIICAQLGACPADLLGSKDGLMQLLTGLEQLLLLLPGQTPILPSGHTQESPQELLPIPLPLCWLCRTFIGKAESVIPKLSLSRLDVGGSNAKTIQSRSQEVYFAQLTAAIGKAMSKLCYILPGAVAGMCQCLMEKYTVIIVDTIVSKLGPRLICGMMFMCASEENCGPESLLPATAEGCQMCLMVSDQVKASLRANRTRRAVEAALSTACSRSFSFWPQCNHFIHQHQPKLSALLMKPWDSQATCQINEVELTHLQRAACKWASLRKGTGRLRSRAAFAERHSLCPGTHLLVLQPECSQAMQGLHSYCKTSTAFVLQYCQVLNIQAHSQGLIDQIVKKKGLLNLGN